MKKLILCLLLLSPLAAQNIPQSNAAPMQASNTIQSNAGFLDAFYIGQDAATNQAPPPRTGENIFFTLLRIAFITGILGFLTWFVLKYFFRKNALSLTQDNPPIEVMAVVPAGMNTYFVVAKLHTFYYLLSLSADGLSLIDKITDKETADFLELHKAPPADAKFTDLLQNLPEGKSRKAIDFLRGQIDRLRKK